MAKGRKTGGRDFKKGQSGNPKGPTPVPQDIRAARKVTQIDFERIANQYLFAKKADLAKASTDPETPIIELMITSIIHKAVVEGDERRLEFLLMRLLGKVKDEVKHTGIPSAPATIVILPAKDRKSNAD
jgi:hypothetical protein